MMTLSQTLKKLTHRPSNNRLKAIKTKAIRVEGTPIQFNLALKNLTFFNIPVMCVCHHENGGKRYERERKRRENDKNFSFSFSQMCASLI